MLKLAKKNKGRISQVWINCHGGAIHLRFVFSGIALDGRQEMELPCRRCCSKLRVSAITVAYCVWRHHEAAPIF